MSNLKYVGDYARKQYFANKNNPYGNYFGNYSQGLTTNSTHSNANLSNAKAPSYFDIPQNSYGNYFGNRLSSTTDTTPASQTTTSANKYSDEHKAKQMAKDYKSADNFDDVSTPKTNTPTTTNTSNGGGYGGGSYGGGSSYSYSGSFAPSQSYLDAMAYTNQLLAQLSSGRTSYTDKINSLMDKIENREKFSYDMNDDPMFQQMLASYMATGKSAMTDTMGQAAALTGGYGSSYATSSANQAYNSYLQEAYDNLPQYYNMALEQYQMEGNDMYNQLGMYQTADANEYQRLYNAYQANYGQAQDQYNHEYSNYWDTTNYNFNVKQHNDDMAYKYANLKADMDYKYKALEEDARQYNETMAYNKTKATTDSTKTSSKTATDSTTTTYKEPTTTQYSKALKAFNNGGYDELYTVLDSFSSNIDVDSIIDYVESNGSLPYDMRTYEGYGKDTINWFGGVDNDDQVRDEFGNVYTLKELKELVYNNLYARYKGQSMTSADAKKKAEADAEAYVKQYNKQKK